MSATSTTGIARAINEAFESANVLDSNGERANVVDMLERVARAGEFQAEAIRLVAQAISQHAEQMRQLAAAVAELSPMRPPSQFLNRK